ncbi:MAG: hypothetical protein WC865_01510 [Bacteroidales bacterium]
MKTVLFLIALLLINLNVFSQAFGSYKKMIDPGIDDPAKPWCYLAKSTTVIGVPHQSGYTSGTPETAIYTYGAVTQVTYDGSLFTNNAELGFFYGKNDIPLMARQKTFYKGWIPIVEYSWNHEGIRYDIEMLATIVDGYTEENTLNLVKVKMTNTAKSVQDAYFTTVARGKYPDCREGDLVGFSPDNQYEITNSSVLREDKLIYTFPKPNKNEAVCGVEYIKPFLGKDYNVKKETAVALSRYQLKLKPNQSTELVFKMPKTPVAKSDFKFIEKINQADYNYYREKTIKYWEQTLEEKVTYEVPELCVQNAQKASAVHLLLATRTVDGKIVQTDGLPYQSFFLYSTPEMTLAYLYMGLPSYAKILSLNAVKKQQSNGRFADMALEQGNGEPPASHGIVLFSLCAYSLFTHDLETINEIYPNIKKAIGYISTETKKNQYGLLPPAMPYDAEMIDGHYTTNNLWALCGLRFAIRLAREMGETNDVQDWEALEKQYSASIIKGIEASVKEDGYVPPGLYHYLTGKAARRGFYEYQTHSDWENMLLAFPSETLMPGNRYVKGTVDRVRKGYAEGIMTYRHGQHLHQYITANLIEQYMVMGESKQALIDFYHLLLHSGSTYEGFENLVRPWTDRQVEFCPPPHAWGAAKIATIIRNLLIYEFGGKAGIEKGKRDIYLFPTISPAWVEKDKHIAINNAPTEFGSISARMTFTVNGASVTITPSFNEQPRFFKVRIPYFKELVKFESDAKVSKLEGDCITVSPDAKTIMITWKDKPNAGKGLFEDLLTAYRSSNSFEGVDSKGFQIVKQHQPFLLDSEKKNQTDLLSFDFVLKTFLHEFDRRREENLKNEYELYKVDAPKIK